MPAGLVGAGAHLDTPAGEFAVSLAPDDIVAGRYRVRAFIASGAFADVYGAVPTAGGADVALKVLREPSAELVARMRAEGRI